MAVEPLLFLAGMRQLAAGVTLVTTAEDDQRAGLTATAICSVSADPPQLLACVNRDAEAHPLILRQERFAVNLLAADQRDLADRFSGRTGCFGAERFEAGLWATQLTGAPILEGCPASFDCRLAASLPCGTHTIFVGLIVAMNVRAGLSPLVYADGDYGLVAPLIG